MSRIIIITILVLVYNHLFAQRDSLMMENKLLDSLYIAEVQSSHLSDKVLHAEPLYIDLIRDLGARKGEREWNLGIGLTDNLKFDTYQALVEYEWAPANRLGLEVEIPFIIIANQAGAESEDLPSSSMESIKTAFQWSFFVSERFKTSMAVGYINELGLQSMNKLSEGIFKGNVYNPFFVVAKRWGSNYHSLIYSGPRIEQHFKTGAVHAPYDINTSFHYMIPGTRNFIGVEVNKTIAHGDLTATIRPQMRLGIAHNFLIGILGGIPVDKSNERFSMFARLIWEPAMRVH